VWFTYIVVGQICKDACAEAVASGARGIGADATGAVLVGGNT